VSTLFQYLQQTVGKTASRIVPPFVFELRLPEILGPTVGWLPEEDYLIRLMQAQPLDLPRIFPPAQISMALLGAPPSSEVDLGRRAGVSESLIYNGLADWGVTNSVALLPAELETLVIPRSEGVRLGEPARVVELEFGIWHFMGNFEKLEDAQLTKSEIEMLHRNLLSVAETNRINRPANTLSISYDLNIELSDLSPTRTEDCFTLFFNQCAISDDLNVPLFGLTRADGKQYINKAKNPDQVPGVDKLQAPPITPNSNEYSHRGGSDQKRILNFWDLVFPLLERPVNLDFGTVIDLPSSLYPYQTKGVEFLLETFSALLGDDMGTGKTVQTSVALRILFQTGKIRTALVVCPLSVIPNWKREIAKWAGNLAVTVVRGDKKHRKVCWRQAAHVWLTTYDTLRNDIELVLASRYGGFELVVLDEAQRVKNWTAGVTRAVRKLEATYRWGLSGTPLENNITELWTILNVLNPGISDAQLDWSDGIRGVLKPMFLRRRKQDVLTDLPPLMQSPVWLQLEDEQRKSYDELEQRGVLELHARGENITAQIIIVLLNKLKQVCNRCPRTGESSKLGWLRDSLENISAEGDKVLIFSQYTDERFAGADWLEKELSNYGALNYSNATSDKQRGALLAAFKEKSEHTVFVGHPKTAGLGLNELVVANYVVHFDHWWNPAVMNQATARAHRPGQTKTVFAYDLWVQDTYEEIIFKLLETKQDLYNEVVDSISAERTPDDNLAFAVADTLFAKYGLNPIQRKPIAKSHSLEDQKRK